MIQIHKAQKKLSKLRLGLAGTSGSGKTYSALLLASGMTSWNKICIIDTENGSADLYSHLGEYNVITLTPDFRGQGGQVGFAPENYIECITAAENADMDVIIIDSITHEWDGRGGCLELVESIAQNSSSKSSYTAWAKITPRHQAFVQKILQSPRHIITTVRRKQDYEMSKDAGGKTKVTKMGLKEITREGFEYELTLSFVIEQNHMATASKDRTGVFMDKPEFVISEHTGKTLLAWAHSGESPITEPVKVEPVEPVKAVKASPAQIKMIHTLCTKKGKDYTVTKKFYKIEHLTDLTKDQASGVIEKLMKYPDSTNEKIEPSDIPF